MSMQPKLAFAAMLICLGAQRAAATEADPRFVALSLREASRRAEAGQVSATLNGLGGITRIGGYIYDPREQDLILIGLVATGLPEGQLDDLVVALRARMLPPFDFPLVSIDPTDNTQRTKLQKVTFLGGLQDTGFGRDLLECDIVLKQATLGANRTGVEKDSPSYCQLLEEAVRSSAPRDGPKSLKGFHWEPGNIGDRYATSKRSADSSVSKYELRFWYKVLKPYKSSGRPSPDQPEVFRIDSVEIMIDRDEKTVASTAKTDPRAHCTQEFTRRFTEQLPKTAERHPILKKLKILYDLTAVADQVAVLRQSMEMPWLDHLLHRYRLAVHPTRSEYPLSELTGIAEREDQTTELIYVCGGIEVRPGQNVVTNLNSGSFVGLRDLVLQVRPSPNALAWDLPLAGWQMPNARDLLNGSEGGGTHAAPGTSSGVPPVRPGCFVYSQSVTLRPPGDDQSSNAEQVFRGFSLPHTPAFGPSTLLPTYELNGVLINPNLVKDKILLPSYIRQLVAESFATGEGPTRRVKIGVKKDDD